ncbi:MAG: hypothetical protein IPM64_16620 [Phycisphaerales bacterium]|nr:hypothetical protein [Phycisphaerales bacterium]
MALRLPRRFMLCVFMSLACITGCLRRADVAPVSDGAPAADEPIVDGAVLSAWPLPRCLTQRSSFELRSSSSSGDAEQLSLARALINELIALSRPPAGVLPLVHRLNIYAPCYLPGHLIPPGIAGLSSATSRVRAWDLLTDLWVETGRCEFAELHPDELLCWAPVIADRYARFLSTTPDLFAPDRQFAYALENAHLLQTCHGYGAFLALNRRFCTLHHVFVTKHDVECVPVDIPSVSVESWLSSVRDRLVWCPERRLFSGACYLGDGVDLESETPIVDGVSALVLSSRWDSLGRLVVLNHDQVDSVDTLIRHLRRLGRDTILPAADCSEIQVPENVRTPVMLALPGYDARCLECRVSRFDLLPFADESGLARLMRLGSGDPGLPLTFGPIRGQRTGAVGVLWVSGGLGDPGTKFTPFGVVVRSWSELERATNSLPHAPALSILAGDSEFVGEYAVVGFPAESLPVWAERFRVVRQSAPSDE